MHQEAADRDSRGPCSGTGRYLFVSYAREDRSRVQPMLTELRSSGVRIWWDEGLAAGQSFADEIERRVHESAGVIVFLSANSTARKDQNWVYQETKLAATHGKEVIPVRLDDTTLPLDWRALVEHRQMVQADAKSPRDRAIDALRSRATALGCDRDGTTGINGMQTTRPPSSVQHIVITALCVVVAVLVTVIVLRPGSEPASGRRSVLDDRDRAGYAADTTSESNRTPPASLRKSDANPPSAPEIPPAYVESIKNETRNWTYSLRSAADNGEVTLHWETCPGIEKMKASNKSSLRGTLEDVEERTGMSARCCRFCYEIEFFRRMRNGEVPPPAATGGG